MSRHYQINQNHYLEFRIDIKLFSENTYLSAAVKNKKTKNGKIIKVPYLYKRSDCRDYQSNIINLLTKNYTDYIKDNSNLIKDNKKFYTEFDYHLESSLTRKDLTNLKKLLEDALVTSINKVLGKGSFDDSNIYETSDIKLDSETEYVVFRIYPITN